MQPYSKTFQVVVHERIRSEDIEDTKAGKVLKMLPYSHDPKVGDKVFFFANDGNRVLTKCTAEKQFILEPVPQTELDELLDRVITEAFIHVAPLKSIDKADEQGVLKQVKQFVSACLPDAEKPLVARLAQHCLNHTLGLGEEGRELKAMLAEFAGEAQSLGKLTKGTQPWEQLNKHVDGLQKLITQRNPELEASLKPWRSALTAMGQQQAKGDLPKVAAAQERELKAWETLSAKMPKPQVYEPKEVKGLSMDL
jgi:hypothetical protein